MSKFISVSGQHLAMGPDIQIRLEIWMIPIISFKFISSSVQHLPIFNKTPYGNLEEFNFLNSFPLLVKVCPFHINMKLHGKGFDSKFQLFIQGWMKYSCFNTKYKYGYTIYQDDACISYAVCMYAIRRLQYINVPG